MQSPGIAALDSMANSLPRAPRCPAGLPDHYPHKSPEICREVGRAEWREYLFRWDLGESVHTCLNNAIDCHAIVVRVASVLTQIMKLYIYGTMLKIRVPRMYCQTPHQEIP